MKHIGILAAFAATIFATSASATNAYNVHIEGEFTDNYFGAPVLGATPAFSLDMSFTTGRRWVRSVPANLAVYTGTGFSGNIGGFAVSGGPGTAYAFLEYFAPDSLQFNVYQYDAATDRNIGLYLGFTAILGGSFLLPNAPFYSGTGGFDLITVTDGPMPTAFYKGPQNVSISVTGTSPTPYFPEPTTWAMMIGGLGFIGSLFRRKSRQLLTA